MDHLQTIQDGQLFDELETIERQLHQDKEKITDAIYDIVGNNPDKKQRQFLLKVRRNIHNLRPLSLEQLHQTLALLPTNIADELSTFQQRLDQTADIIAQLQHLYPKALANAREQFRQLAANEDLQKGLLLSSESLFSSTRHYTERPPRSKLKKRQLKVEQSLLRYFSRMAMKTTPFGTFCAVVPGHFTDGDGQADSAFAFPDDPSVKKSFIRINKGLYGLLLNHFKARVGVREYLEVELNPTIRQEADQLIFLAAVQNREVFQRLRQNAIFSLVMAVFKEQPTLPLNQLIEKICTNPQIEADPEEASAYLDKLLEIGFLRFRTGIREQDANWDIPLRALLEAIEDEQAQQIATLLATLREKTERYALAPAKEREGLLNDIRTLINDALASLNIQATAQTPFYEDATANVMLEVPLAQAQHALKTLQRFIALTLPLSWPRTEQATMRHFFDTYYQQNKRIPLLQFYEDYYREHFKAHLEKQRMWQSGHQDEAVRSYNQANPFNLDIIQDIYKAQQALSTLVRERWSQTPTAEVVSIGLAEIEQITDTVAPFQNIYHSVSVFTQFIPHYHEHAALVMPNGNYMGGYGKYFSRFLYMFPEHIQQTLYDENNRLTQEYVAEICGDAQFNANLHPPLVQWEISYPTGEGGQVENQIPSSELYVEPDPDNGYALRLHHPPSHKQVYAVDLGFLNPRMRPPLYQLLSRFMPVAGFSIHIPDTLTPPPHAQPAADSPNEAAKDNPNPTPPSPTITYRPRIACEDCLILARRRWQVPAALFPSRAPNEKDDDYFIRVNRWRKTHNIPAEVFVRIQTLPLPPPPPQTDPKDGEKPEPKPAKKQQAAPVIPRDLYKPQYINFYNPLLVHLFEKRVKSLPNFMVNIEEMLPDRDNLARHQDAQYVTEFILQFGYPDDTTATNGERDV